MSEPSATNDHINGHKNSSNVKPTMHGGPFDILSTVNKNAEALLAGDAKARDAMVADCFSLIAALETPSETFMRMMWTYTIHPVVLRIASDMRLFEHLRLGQGKATSAEIAAMSSMDADMTRKILLNLATFHVVKEVEVDTFAPTPFSDAMADQTYIQAVELMIPYCSRVNLKSVDYFRENNYKLPTDALDTPMQYANDVRGKLHMFDILQRDSQMQGLESLMKVWLDKRPHWSNEAAGYYPVRKRLLDGADQNADDVFLVDIGGGQGQDFPRLLSNVAEDDLPGRLVLQDLATVIESVPHGALPAKVEMMAHDFFTPQPIKGKYSRCLSVSSADHATGARVYFMHNIIHNHTDAKARILLKHTAAAMRKGYSKLLLWDNVMPDKGAGSTITCLDWEMISFYATGERTETQWRSLLENPDLGLKVTDIIHYSRYDQTLIELELA